MFLTRTIRKASFLPTVFLATAFASFAQQSQPPAPVSSVQPAPTVAPQAAAPSDATFSGTGVVRTAESSPVPGAAVRFTETTTTKSWASWTDQAGKFNFPALPAGHYRVEASQLGFVAASLEVDIPAASNNSIELVVRVATLAELSGESKPVPQNARAAEKRKPGAGPPASGSSASANPPGGILRTRIGPAREDRTAAMADEVKCPREF